MRGVLLLLIYVVTSFPLISGLWHHTTWTKWSAKNGNMWRRPPVTEKVAFNSEVIGNSRYTFLNRSSHKYSVKIPCVIDSLTEHAGQIPVLWVASKQFIYSQNNSTNMIVWYYHKLDKNIFVERVKVSTWKSRAEKGYLAKELASLIP